MRSKDLNTPQVTKETWNRQEHILRLISYGQMYVTYGDIHQDLRSMYQGLQIILDTITPDFSEKPKEEEMSGEKPKYAPGTILRGIKTKKFQTYRKLLDESNALHNSSNKPHINPYTRNLLKNSSYKKLQELKYALLQECESLGYNARKTDATDTYRRGNN